MAKKYYLDKRVFVLSPKGLSGGQAFLPQGNTPVNPNNSINQLNLDNFLDLEAYIEEVVSETPVDASSISVDTINERTPGTLVDFPDNLKTDEIAESTVDAGVTIDGVLVKDGGVSNAAETQFAGFYPVAPLQELSGPGAINVTSHLTSVTTTGPDAFTLADGTQVGQLKKVVLAADGGDGTITPTTTSGFTSVVLDDPADYVVFLWTGTAWVIVDFFGGVIS